MMLFYKSFLFAYHINKAPIDLHYPVLETSNNTKFLLCIKDKIWPHLEFYQMPHFIEVKQAAKSGTYNSAGTRKTGLGHENNSILSLLIK